MAKRQIQYATITTAVSIRFDGVNVARVIAERDVWLSDGFVFRLLFVGIITRFLASIWADVVATWRHVVGMVRYAPQWMSTFFVWRLFCNAIYTEEQAKFKMFDFGPRLQI